MRVRDLKTILAALDDSVEVMFVAGNGRWPITGHELFAPPAGAKLHLVCEPQERE